MRLFKVLILFVLIFTAGCASYATKKEAFPQMYNERPLSILVLPPINQTTAADAKEYYSVTVAEPLSLMGYYVFPIEVTSEILKNEGFYDTELLINTPPQKFRQYFGADAVMYIEILKWDTSYYVIGGNVKVSVDCVLKSTISGENLWKYGGTMVLDTTGGDGGVGGLAGLLVKVALTAAQTAAADYMPLARRANFMIMSSLPYGKYHPQHNQDGDSKIKIIKEENVEKN
ncbi:GNA1162 family protein [Dissulfurispira sp.]|uniref:GNA1162 family protein n=1 Tax=Dissulfurispira sp. TaxID=2817609 RepID=UPI002FD9D42A